MLPAIMFLGLALIAAVAPYFYQTTTTIVVDEGRVSADMPLTISGFSGETTCRDITIQNRANVPLNSVLDYTEDSNPDLVTYTSNLDDRAFHSLAEKGLITYVFEGKIKQYQAIEPKLLLGFLEEKKARLEKLLPELDAKRNLQKESPKATTFQGVRGIKELLNLMLETDKKEYFAYGGAQKSNELLGDFFWESFHKKRVTKKIKAQLVFHKSLESWANHLKKLKLAEIRITHSDFEELTETIICGSRVAIIIYLDKPFGFLIDEELAAKSYRKFFEIIWNNSK